MTKRAGDHQGVDSNSSMSHRGGNPPTGQSTATAGPLAVTSMGIQEKLNPDLWLVILKYFLPSGSHLLRPYDAAAATEPVYWPTMRMLAALEAACKSFHACVGKLRVLAVLYDYARHAGPAEHRRRVQLEVDGYTSMSGQHPDPVAFDNIVAKDRALRVVRYQCDPNSSAAANIPLRAAFTVLLDQPTKAELRKKITFANSLRDRAEKQWRGDNPHAISVEYLDSAESCEALVRLLNEKCDLVQELDLRRIDSKIEQEELANAVSRCKHLRHLALAHAGQQLLEAVKTLPSLLSLKLSDCTADKIFNHLGESSFTGTLECLSISGGQKAPANELDTLEALAEKFLRLKDFRLNWMKTSQESRAPLLAKCFTGFLALERLSFKGLDGDEAVAIGKAIKASTLKIRHLEIVQSSLPAAASEALLIELKAYPSLQVLELSANIQEKGVAALIEMLRHEDCALHKLALASLYLEEPHGSLFAEALVAQKDLRMLKIGNLRPHSARAFATALTQSTSLQSVSISLPYQVSESSVLAIAKAALDSSSLISLDLAAENWTAASDSTILQLLQMKRRTNKSLFHLTLPWISRKKDAADALEEELHLRRNANTSLAPDQNVATREHQATPGNSSKDAV